MVDSLTAGGVAIATFLPKLLGFIVILVIGYFIAKAIAKGLSLLLERVGFDKAVERGGVRKLLAKSKYDASDFVSKIIYYALLLFVLQFAFGVFGENPISDLLAAVIAFLPKLIVAIVIVVVAAAIAAVVKDLISNALGGLSYGRLLSNIASVFIIALGVIAALNQIEVATTVTTPILIAFLATISGVIIVGAGGGLIKPMQSRWDGILDSLVHESKNVKQEADSAPSATDHLRNRVDDLRDNGDSRSSSETHTLSVTPVATDPRAPRQ